MAKKTEQKSPVALLLRGELMGQINVTKAQMNAYILDGMPHYLIGNEYRFLETDVLAWLEAYQPSQERLEREFRDKKGRTLDEYVTEEIVLSTLRISKEKMIGLCKTGMPFVRVGEKDFFHIQDILNYYRKGGVITKGTSASSSKKKYLMPLCANISKDVPVMIIDGSYSFDDYKAGTGLVLVKNMDTATGMSNVRSIKTTKPIVCEFLALLDALRSIKKNKFNKAIIVTDQEAWTRGIAIDVNIYEAAVKPYMKEIDQLLTELKGKAVIKFVGEMNKGKKNVLYKKADSLSKEYKKGIFEGVVL